MDAPNAPNPANPNAQAQFMDAVQGPTAQAEGPAAQNQAQGLTTQDQVQGPAAQVQGPAAQGPAKNNAPSWSKCTCSALTTPSPSTTSPCWSGGTCPSSSLSKLGRKET